MTKATEQLYVRLPAEHVRLAKQTCDELGMSMAEFARHCFHLGFADALRRMNDIGTLRDALDADGDR